MSSTDKKRDMKPRVMVFCKAPIPDQVKTRLTSEFSGEDAAKIHEQLARETLQDCLQLADVELELWCSPDCHHEFFACFEQQGFKLIAQQGDDLGARMAAAFAAKPDCPGILIGTDCPTINAAYLSHALNALGQADVVFAPAEDGGYGLIGMNQSNPGVFRDVAWSTSRVLAKSQANCLEAGLSVSLLPEIWDVDYPEDVQRWRALRNHTSNSV